MSFPIQLTVPGISLIDPVLATEGIAVPTTEFAGVNTSGEETEFPIALVLVAIVLVVVGVVAGVLGFRSTRRKKERLEDRDVVGNPGQHR